MLSEVAWGDGVKDEEFAGKKDAFTEKVISSLSGAFTIFSVYLGDRLGFYQALSSGDYVTSHQLSAATGTSERYCREWLEQQTVIGVLTVDDPDAAAQRRRFHLPGPHAEVLTNQDSLDYLMPLAQLFVGATHPLNAVLEAYRRGRGVPYADYGVDLREGQGAINRSAFLFQLGSEWLPSIPDVHARLSADPPARVADVGCGVGWSSIGIARGYPKVLVDGIDLDGPSIEQAITNASDAGMADRLHFYASDAGDPAFSARYDLVTAFECIHDMSNPVAVLKAMRGLLVQEGCALVVDERVGTSFMAGDSEVDWMMYGWSILHCLPVGMADQPSAATGTVMRPETLRGYALEAGFRTMEILPIDNFLFRFYRLDP